MRSESVSENFPTYSCACICAAQLRFFVRLCMRKVNVTIKQNNSIRLRMREVGVAADGTHNAINSVTVGIMEQTDERKNKYGIP